MQLEYVEDFIKDYPIWDISETDEEYQCPNYMCDYIQWCESRIKGLLYNRDIQER